MDAFEQVKRKGDRKIRLRVEPPDNAGNITALYSDNATGIIGTKLVGGPSRLEAVPMKQRIFEPHVTSKRDPEAGYRARPGAGLGLFLVRKIMDDHSGSIDLLESREGVRFRLHFPRLLIEDKSK
jgi:nitrogen fixation/metabolism regulation signal transduction histidine kinase